MSDFNRLDYKTELHGRIVKARINHRCDGCGDIIQKGEEYDFSDGISARYKNEYGETQRGQYWTFRTHIYDCVTPEECLKGNHHFKEIAPNFDDLFPGDYETRCIECGLLQPDMHDLQEKDLLNIAEKGQSDNR